MNETIGEVLANRRRAGRVLRLYLERDMAPTHWIGEADGGELYAWPAEADGWSRRHRYTGDLERLREVESYNAAGTGWPGLARIGSGLAAEGGR